MQRARRDRAAKQPCTAQSACPMPKALRPLHPALDLLKACSDLCVHWHTLLKPAHCQLGPRRSDPSEAQKHYVSGRRVPRVVLTVRQLQMNDQRLGRHAIKATSRQPYRDSTSTDCATMKKTREAKPAMVSASIASTLSSPSSGTTVLTCACSAALARRKFG